MARISIGLYCLCILWDYKNDPDEIIQKMIRLGIPEHDAIHARKSFENKIIQIVARAFKAGDLDKLISEYNLRIKKPNRKFCAALTLLFIDFDAKAFQGHLKIADR